MTSARCPCGARYVEQEIDENERDEQMQRAMDERIAGINDRLHENQRAIDERLSGLEQSAREEAERAKLSRELEARERRKTHSQLEQIDLKLSRLMEAPRSEQHVPA